jgi:hypothetical protein
LRKPREQQEDLSFHSHTKTQKNTTMNFLFLNLSQDELEELTLEKKSEERKSGREVREIGAPSSYLTGLLHNSSFAPKYFESNHFNSRALWSNPR